MFCCFILGACQFQLSKFAEIEEKRSERQKLFPTRRNYFKALVVMQVYFQLSDVLKTLKQKQSKVGFK